MGQLAPHWIPTVLLVREGDGWEDQNGTVPTRTLGRPSFSSGVPPSGDSPLIILLV